MKPTNKNVHTVWIEIERGDDKEENQKRAELFTNMINRLRGGKQECKVWWFEEKNRYAYISTLEDGSYVILDDDGHLFNLELYGRD